MQPNHPLHFCLRYLQIYSLFHLHSSCLQSAADPFHCELDAAASLWLQFPRHVLFSFCLFTIPRALLFRLPSLCVSRHRLIRCSVYCGSRSLRLVPTASFPPFSLSLLLLLSLSDHCHYNLTHSPKKGRTYKSESLLSSCFDVCRNALLVHQNRHSYTRGTEKREPQMRFLSHDLFILSFSTGLINMGQSSAVVIVFDLTCWIQTQHTILSLFIGFTLFFFGPLVLHSAKWGSDFIYIF